MDFTLLVTQLFTGFWYLIPLFILAVLIKSPWFKGVMGEFLVNFSTRHFLDKDTYRLIKNVTLPSGEGTTQIDHVIVSVYGVFVVETKNMKAGFLVVLIRSSGRKRFSSIRKSFRTRCIKTTSM